MHENSLIALSEINTDGSKEKRKKAILGVFGNARTPLRDWDVLQALFPGSSDMNLVRPRVTELHGQKILIEGHKARSPYSNRPVRTSLLRAGRQTNLLDNIMGDVMGSIYKICDEYKLNQLKEKENVKNKN